MRETPVAGCQSCPIHHAANLHKLGVEMQDWDYVVALAGNPNTGKSTVFNALTGLRQHTGNWPGKTVARAEGGFAYAGKRFKLVDLPGTYSLLSTTVDEQIARDFILFGRPDVTVVVVDANRLERNLNLTLQVLELTDRVVVCLNLMDEARRHGLQVDQRRLARDLGAPVVPTSARHSEGLDELLEVIEQVASGRVIGRRRLVQLRSQPLQSAVQQLSNLIRRELPKVPHARWVAMRLLDGDPRVREALQSGELQAISDEPAPAGRRPGAPPQEASR